MESLWEALQPAVLIDRTELELLPEVIGKSQFEVRAGVYRQQPVAVKIIPLLSMPEKSVMNLKKEVLAMRECESPYVVHVHGVCLVSSEAYIVMERMCCSLVTCSYGVNHRKLSFEEAVTLSLSMARGLEFLHSKSFIHRDVKPENLLLSSPTSLDVKWTDFGLASAVLTSMIATKSNIGAGTPFFMSPEQTDTTPGIPVTRAADIWSLGCVILCVLTNSTPWPVEYSTVQLVTALLVRHQSPALDERIPKPMRQLLKQCFQSNPENRPKIGVVVEKLEKMQLAILENDASTIEGQEAKPSLSFGSWLKQLVGRSPNLSTPSTLSSSPIMFPNSLFPTSQLSLGTSIKWYAQKKDGTAKLVLCGSHSQNVAKMLVASTLSDQMYMPAVFDNYEITAPLSQSQTTYQLSIWDTTGMEEFDRLRPLTYVGADIVFTCFNLCRPVSLQNVLHKWGPEVRFHLPRVPIVLVGVKSLQLDTPAVQRVTAEEARKVGQKMKALDYIELDADSESISECCKTLVEEMIPRYLYSEMKPMHR